MLDGVSGDFSVRAVGRQASGLVWCMKTAFLLCEHELSARSCSLTQLAMMPASPRCWHVWISSRSLASTCL